MTKRFITVKDRFVGKKWAGFIHVRFKKECSVSKSSSLKKLNDISYDTSSSVSSLKTTKTKYDNVQKIA